MTTELQGARVTPRFFVFGPKEYRAKVKESSAIAHLISLLYICDMDEYRYIDDDWVAELVEEARLYDGIEVDISWYKGAGWYDCYLRRIDGEA